jgi:hypothetical protein
VLLALLCVAGLDRSSAQNANTKPRILVINEYTVKSGMMLEYLEWSQKEARPLYLKAGVKEAYVFTTLYGERGQVSRIEIHDSFAALKERDTAFTKNNSPEALAAWRRGVSRYLEPGRTIIAETRPELSWRNPKRQDMAPYFVLVRRRIASFRDSDYENYLKNEYLPLFKKADGAGIVVSRVRFGGESGIYNVAIPIYDLAEFDGLLPVPKSIGQEAFRKLQQKGLAGVVVSTDMRVLQLRPELSIIPGQSTEAR